MISLERCRKILGSEGLSDPELQAVLDGCVALANLLVDHFAGSLPRCGTESTAGLESQFDRLLATIPDEDRDIVEERAAIREFDGAMERPTAEITALKDYLKKRGGRGDSFSKN